MLPILMLLDWAASGVASPTVSAVGYYKRLPGIGNKHEEVVGIESRYVRLVGPSKSHPEMGVD